MTEKKILVICPICSKAGRVAVPVDIIQKKETGATSVYISRSVVCDHEFYAYVDHNFDVRDYLALEYSLMDEKQKAEGMKAEILRKIDEFNLEYSNLLRFINERDLRALIFACYIESPLIFIEDDPNQERFGVIFSFMYKLFPDHIKTARLFPADRYLKYYETNKEKLEKYTVYNVAYKISVSKPFVDSHSEPLDIFFDIIKNTAPKLQIVYAKNFIDYLIKFSEEMEPMLEEKSDKIIKYFKKEYPKQENYFTQPLILMIKDRQQRVKERKSIIKALPTTEPAIVKAEAQDFSDTSLYYYNADIVKNTIGKAEMLTDPLEKLALQTMRHEKTASLKKLMDEMEKSAADVNFAIDWNKIPDIIENFLKNSYIMKM